MSSYILSLVSTWAISLIILWDIIANISVKPVKTKLNIHWNIIIFFTVVVRPFFTYKIRVKTEVSVMNAYITPIAFMSQLISLAHFQVKNNQTHTKLPGLVENLLGSWALVKKMKDTTVKQFSTWKGA